MGKTAVSEKLRWSSDGLATIGNTIVGSVKLNEVPNIGGVNGDWFAYGMMDEWERYTARQL